MKKQSLVIFLSVIFILSCLALTACHSCEFGEWKVVLPASCTDSGLEERLCICGEKETREIDANGHIDGDWIQVKEPTCSSQGSKNLLCANCDEILKTESISATGVHNFQNSDICDYCEINIADLAVATYNMSATLADNVTGYVIPYKDGKHDVYIKGAGAMKDYRYETTHDSALFYNDDFAIVNAYIQNGITNIGNCTFIDCESLEYVEIPSSVLIIGVDAFSFCSNLLEVTIPESVVSILEGAFQGCSSIKSIIIPKNVDCIGLSAFTGCASLSSIIIKGNPNDIGWLAFYDTAFHRDNSNWQNLALYIGNCLVDAKKSIKSCVVRDDTTIIADHTFNNCKELTNITIPSSVTIIGDQAFRYCTELTDIYYEGSQEQWSAIMLGEYNECLNNATIHYNYTGE